MEHGKFPVPPPAVTELLMGIPVYSTEIEGELITPTAAAIIATLCSSYGRLPDLTPELASYGAGTRNYEKFPNTLRVIIGETEANNIGGVSEDLTVLETNIDDSTPQIAGFVMERAFKLGARDCWITPIQMKKNRPAFMISILCDLTSKQRMLELLHTETTTIGVREQAVRRDALDREERNVNTAFGAISVKISKLNGKIVNAMPEYEDVRAAAIANEVPFKTVHNAALDALSEKAIAVTGHNA